MAADSDLKIIDSHLHIWQRSRFAYHWLEVGSALDRDFRLEDIRREMAALNVVGGLLMEATNTPEEIPWLLAICEADPRCLGVIGWIHLEEADASEQTIDLRSISTLKACASTGWPLALRHTTWMLRCWPFKNTIL
jgi:L-fuconolactonase